MSIGGYQPDRPIADPPLWLVQMRRPGSVVLLFCFAMATVALKNWLYPPPPFVNPRIASSRYELPAGCVRKTYYKRDAIPAACADRRYYLGDEYRYGFPQHSKGRPEYFRVGNDAIDIACPIFGDGCFVDAVVRDVFVVK
jgi:hypothetical protein